MRIVIWQQLRSDGSFRTPPLPTAESVLFERVPTQQLAASMDLAFNKRLRVFTIGRDSRLGRELKVGDLLDRRWSVAAIHSDAKGRIEAVAQLIAIEPVD